MDEPANRTLLYWAARDADDNPVATVRDDELAQLCGTGTARWFAPNDSASPMTWPELAAAIDASDALNMADAVVVSIAPPGRSWSFSMRTPAAWVNTNEERSGKKHWSELAADIKLWRDAGHTHALAAGLRAPRVQLRQAEVEAVVRFPDDPTIRDSPNAYPSIKAVIDGALVDTGVLPDDNDRHLAGLIIRPGPPIPVRPYGPAGLLTITIREV